MQLKIIENEEIVKDPIKFLHKNFQLVVEGEKLYLKYELDNSKELRIFFKNTLLKPKIKQHIISTWDTGTGLKELLDTFWIVKASSGVLLFVPEDTEMNKKDGVFFLVITKNYLYPSPLYFKRSFINNTAIALFYVTSKSFVFILGKNDINAIVNNQNGIVLNRYLLQEN